VTEQIRNSIEWIASLTGGTDDAAREKAILTFSAFVGAVVLARATSDEEFSREILKKVAEVLKKPIS
jgi:TetR/AcrR family transcriptional repressor of nem operon